MSEVEGGASEEERAEAEKFSEMVSEGKLTPAEMAEVEKDKTPEEIEAEKAAMEKLMDIEEIFNRDLIFGEYQNKAYRRHYLKTKRQVREDLLTVQNYFHHVGSVANTLLLKRPNFNSLSAYPFWMSGRGKLPPFYHIGHQREVAERLDISVVISRAATNRSRQNAIDKNFWGEDDGRENWPESGHANEIPYYLFHAEALLHDSDRGRPEDFRAVIIADHMLSEAYNIQTGEVLTAEKYRECEDILKPIQDARDRINAGINSGQPLLKERREELEVEDENLRQRYLTERSKLYKSRPASKEAAYLITRELGMVSQVPIFDSDGNLLWPRQMSKEEVVEYIQQRKKEKGEQRKQT